MGYVFVLAKKGLIGRQWMRDAPMKADLIETTLARW